MAGGWSVIVWWLVGHSVDRLVILRFVVVVWLIGWFVGGCLVGWWVVEVGRRVGDWCSVVVRCRLV